MAEANLSFPESKDNARQETDVVLLLPAEVRRVVAELEWPDGEVPAQSDVHAAKGHKVSL